eukprot:7936880-Lingulodinium_polyedra.AAC.1
MALRSLGSTFAPAAASTHWICPLGKAAGLPAWPVWHGRPLWPNGDPRLANVLLGLEPGLPSVAFRSRARARGLASLPGPHPGTVVVRQGGAG